MWEKGELECENELVMGNFKKCLMVFYKLLLLVKMGNVRVTNANAREKKREHGLGGGGGSIT